MNQFSFNLCKETYGIGSFMVFVNFPFIYTFFFKVGGVMLTNRIFTLSVCVGVQIKILRYSCYKICQPYK